MPSEVRLTHLEHQVITAVNSSRRFRNPLDVDSLNNQPTAFSERFTYYKGERTLIDGKPAPVLKQLPVHTLNVYQQGNIRAVEVPSGHEIVLSELDDETALVTLDLYGCAGLGLRFEKKGADQIFGLGHFNFSIYRALMDTISLTESELVPKQRIQSILRGLVRQTKVEVNKALADSATNIAEVKPTDIYRSPSGILITNNGGLFMREKIRRAGLTYEPISRWEWSE